MDLKTQYDLIQKQYDAEVERIKNRKVEGFKVVSVQKPSNAFLMFKALQEQWHFLRQCKRVK